MVCPRCIQAVQQAAEFCEIKIRSIDLGELETEEPVVNTEQLYKFDNVLKNLGFERFDDKKTRLVERVKALIIQHIHHSNEDLNITWSTLIADALHYEYNYISNLFSAYEGITIEQFIIQQKIEKIKELLSYQELSIAEIAFRLGYSSSSYLSNQFRKYTGMTPGQYSKLTKSKRKSIDKL